MTSDSAGRKIRREVIPLALLVPPAAQAHLHLRVRVQVLHHPAATAVRLPKMATRWRILIGAADLGTKKINLTMKGAL